MFLEVRVVSGLGGGDADLAITETIVWTCVALSLLFADIVIQWQDLRSKRPVTPKAVLSVS